MLIDMYVNNIRRIVNKNLQHSDDYRLRALSNDSPCIFLFFLYELCNPEKLPRNSSLRSFCAIPRILAFDFDCFR